MAPDEPSALTRHRFAAILLLQQADLQAGQFGEFGAGFEVGRRRVKRLAGGRDFAAFVILHDAVEPRNHPLECTRFVGNLELQERRLLDNVGGTIGIVDARELDHDAITADLLHHWLRHAKLVDASANDLERAIEGRRLVGDRSSRLIDLEREMHAALQIQSFLERHATHRVVDEHAGAVALAFDHVTREKRPRRAQNERCDREQPVLQVHAEDEKRCDMLVPAEP